MHVTLWTADLTSQNEAGIDWHLVMETLTSPCGHLVMRRRLTGHGAHEQMLEIVVADPGFPVGGRGPRGGAWTPEAFTFRKFVCQSERIGTLRGDARRVRPPGSANDKCTNESK